MEGQDSLPRPLPAAGRTPKKRIKKGHSAFKAEWPINPAVPTFALAVLSSA